MGGPEGKRQISSLFRRDKEGWLQAEKEQSRKMLTTTHQGQEKSTGKAYDEGLEILLKTESRKISSA